MSLSTMYAAVNNSPVTSLSAGAGVSDTELTVADGSVLPVGPNLVTLGDSETAEVVCYQSRSGNVLSGCVRGIGGTSASVWPAGTTAARNFTAYDHDTFRANILDLDTRVVPSGGAEGQVLAKASADDFDIFWKAPYPFPTGGEIGTALVKASLDDGDVMWEFDTGWFQMPVQNLTIAAGGGVFMRRRGDTVYVKFQEVKLAAALNAGASVAILTTIPEVFNAAYLSVAGMAAGKLVLLAKNSTSLSLFNPGSAAIAKSSDLYLSGSYFMA